MIKDKEQLKKFLEAIGSDDVNIVSSYMKDGIVDVVAFEYKYYTHEMEPNEEISAEDLACVKIRSEYPVTPLQIAAFRNSTKVLEYLIGLVKQKGQSIDFSGSNDGNALHEAAGNDSVEAIEILLQHGANIESRTINNETPLHRAAEKNNIAAMIKLIEKGADKEALDKEGRTPIYSAVYGESEGAMKLLIESGIDINRAPGLPLIIYAIINNKLKSLAYLLGKNANKDVTDESGYTALHKAIDRNNLEAVQILVENKSNINSLNKINETPLILALKKLALNIGSSEIVRYILSRKPILNIQDTVQWTAPNIAAYIGDVDIFKKVLEILPDKNFMDKNNNSLINTAARNNKVGILEILFENKANLDTPNAESKTPLFRAVEFESKEAAEFLVKHNANVEIMCNGETALSYAIKNNKHYFIKLLLENNKNSINFGETTLLHKAVEENNIDFLSIILKIGKKSGINVNAIDKKGNLPIFLAIEKDDEKLLNLIIKEGANLDSINDNKRTPLMCAIINKKYIALNCLLRVPGTLGEKDCRILYEAVAKDEEELMKILISCAVEKEELLKILISYAVEKKDEDLVKMLIKKGTSLQSKKIFKGEFGVMVGQENKEIKKAENTVKVKPEVKVVKELESKSVKNEIEKYKGIFFEKIEQKQTEEVVFEGILNEIIKQDLGFKIAIYAQKGVSKQKIIETIKNSFYEIRKDEFVSKLTIIDIPEIVEDKDLEEDSQEEERLLYNKCIYLFDEKTNLEIDEYEVMYLRNKSFYLNDCIFIEVNKYTYYEGRKNLNDKVLSNITLEATINELYSSTNYKIKNTIEKTVDSICQKNKMLNKLNEDQYDIYRARVWGVVSKLTLKNKLIVVMKGFDLSDALTNDIHGTKDIYEKFLKEMKDSKDLEKALSIVINEIKKEKYLNVAVIGQTGAGKSSIINILANLSGSEAAPAGVKFDLTTFPRGYKYKEDKIMLVDYPGYGTPSFPTETSTDLFGVTKRGFLDTFCFDGYDLVIGVFNGKFNDHDICVFNRFSRKRNFILVRTYSENLSNEEIMELKTEVAEKIKNFDVSDNLYFVNSDNKIQPDTRIDIYKINQRLMQYANNSMNNSQENSLKLLKQKRCIQIFELIATRFFIDAEKMAIEVNKNKLREKLMFAACQVGVCVGAIFTGPLAGLVGTLSVGAVNMLFEGFITGEAKQNVKQIYGISQSSIKPSKEPSNITESKDEKESSEWDTAKKAGGVLLQGICTEVEGGITVLNNVVSYCAKNPGQCAEAVGKGIVRGAENLAIPITVAVETYFLVEGRGKNNKAIESSKAKAKEITKTVQDRIHEIGR